MAVDERRTDDLVYEIEPSVQEELIKHPGKWVAMTRSKVLAIRDAPAEAYAAGREAGVGLPISTRSPTSGRGTRTPMGLGVWCGAPDDRFPSSRNSRRRRRWPWSPAKHPKGWTTPRSHKSEPISTK